jgi:hypothetical protein
VSCGRVRPLVLGAAEQAVEIATHHRLHRVRVDAVDGDDNHAARVAGARRERDVAGRVRLIASLGAPTAAYVRDDITGGMATITYEGGRIRLTQWLVPAT